MSKAQKTLLILAGCVLAFMLGLKLVDTMPSMFTPLQQSILLGTIISFILVISLKTIFKHV